jgi:PKD repeat protein
LTWRWDFGDPESSPSNNVSDQQHPVHNYSDTGQYTVRLTVTNENDCEDVAEQVIELHPSPTVDFSWNSSCKSYAPVILTGQEILSSPDTVTIWTWSIDTSGTEIFHSDTAGSRLTYHFPEEGSYGISYRIETGLGCVETLAKTLTLSHTYSLYPDQPYLQDFESAGHGWEAVALDESHNSWTLDEIDNEEFPYSASSGTQAWYTNVPDAPTAEQSYVISPCFSFDNFHRPMVALDIKRSLHRDRDGAALQYTVDNGNTWHNVGDVEDGGRNWFNSSSITPWVGGHKTGWTGGFVAEEDTGWYESAHVLDMLTGEPAVRFRIAFGSLDDQPQETNEGFAFDKFTIRQRTRLSLLEYFTNANTPYCEETDTVVLNVFKELPTDFVLVGYHAQGDQADEFYKDNPVPASNRGTVYGVSEIPYAVLDGGFRSYDFSGSQQTPSIEDIRLRTLKDPDFNLTITIAEFTPELAFSIEIEAVRDLEQSERTLHAIVLERKVTDPAYVGTNGTTEFWQVARKMVPNAAGTYLGNRSWTEGETEYADLRNEPIYFPPNEDSIIIVVFIQDDETREILQVASSFQYNTSAFDETAPEFRVWIYPNPARELVNVRFEDTPEHGMRFMLYELSGRMVMSDVIEPWQQHFTRSIEELPWGMYIVEIRSGDKKRVLYRDKLLHY